MHARPLALLTAVLTLAGLAATGAPARAATAPTLPAQDPFYAYANSTDGKAGMPLASIPAGTVLNTRVVTLGLGSASLPTELGSLPTVPGVSVPGTATQLLYRTQDEQGKPTVTVTTVLVPPGATADPKIVAYLSFYDSLSGKCDPSYTLQGGSPGPSSNDELTDLEQGLVELYQSDLDAVVTIPDFEGEALHWTAGHEAGYGTLDAIRATESFLAAPAATTQVGLTGYSGGSIAADWASELAPTYGKGLDLVGVAEGGIPVDFAHNLTYIDGSQQWSGIIPAVLVALSRADDIPLDTYLSAYGKQLAATDADECIGEFLGSHPGLTVAQLVKPQYRDFLQVPAFVTVVNSLLMGSVPGHPEVPLYMAVGNDPTNAQGQGDDIMVTGDVEALAHEYCSQGVTVDYQELSGLDHEEAALGFEPQAIAYLAQRFLGAPATNDCSTVGTGNSLAPLTIAQPASPSPATTTATTSPTSPTTRATPAPAAAVPVASSAALAFTGSRAGPAIAALALLSAGGAGLALRRRR